MRSSDFVITPMATGRIGLHLVLLPLPSNRRLISIESIDFQYRCYRLTTSGLTPSYEGNNSDGRESQIKAVEITQNGHAVNVRSEYVL